MNDKYFSNHRIIVNQEAEGRKRKRIKSIIKKNKDHNFCEFPNKKLINK